MAQMAIQVMKTLSESKTVGESLKKWKDGTSLFAELNATFLAHMTHCGRGDAAKLEVRLGRRDADGNNDGEGARGDDDDDEEGDNNVGVFLARLRRSSSLSSSYTRNPQNSNNNDKDDDDADEDIKCAGLLDESKKREYTAIATTATEHAATATRTESFWASQACDPEADATAIIRAPTNPLGLSEGDTEAFLCGNLMIIRVLDDGVPDEIYRSKLGRASHFRVDFVQQLEPMPVCQDEECGVPMNMHPVGPPTRKCTTACSHDSRESDAEYAARWRREILHGGAPRGTPVHTDFRVSCTAKTLHIVVFAPPGTPRSSLALPVIPIPANVTCICVKCA